VQGARLAAASALFVCLLVAAQALEQRWQTTEVVRAFGALAGMLCIAVILVSTAEMRRLGAGAIRELRSR
jgi:hypothetical protein